TIRHHCATSQRAGSPIDRFSFPGHHTSRGSHGRSNKNTARVPTLGCVVGGMAAPPPRFVLAMTGHDVDRTLAPYFFVHSDDPQVDQLPLKDTQVEIAIAGVIADVKVTQRYHNDGTRPIEAEYVFPGSMRAAVYGLTMTIGEGGVVARTRGK